MKKGIIIVKRVVFISPVNIYDNTGDGGVKASREHLRFVQEYFGVENVNVCIYLKPNETINYEGIKVLKKEISNLKLLVASLFGCKLYLPWHEKEIIQYIDECNPDLLFLDFSLLGRLIRLKRSYKTVVFFHNIESDYFMSKVKKQGIYYITSYWAAKYNDKWATKADKVICLNERDAKRLYECYRRKADLLIPISFDDYFCESCTTTIYERKLLFLGSLFSPNQISIEWFIKEVMPKLDNIKLSIVGKGFEKKKNEYEQNPNVKVFGTVQSVESFYYNHCAVVLPIKYGAGMKVKTAEAMMYGRRIFASDEALEGYDIEDISGITRCNTAEEFADAINDYFDHGILKNYEEDVRKRFMEKYETTCLLQKFHDLFDNIFEYT